MTDAGYGIFADVFEPPELEPAIAALDGDLSTRSRAGARHVLALPAVRALAEDPRMLRLADRFVAGARPFRATLFDKSARPTGWSCWHRDTALPMVRELDAPARGRGRPRRLLDDADIERLASRIEPIACTVAAGGDGLRSRAGFATGVTLRRG